jgi:hypothetical protein
VEWERTLLSLTPAACAHLLDYWDTLTPVAVGQHGANGAQTHTTACNCDTSSGDGPAVATSTPEPSQPTASNGSATTSNNSSTRTSTQVPDLDAFFEQLFAPCGDNVTKVRYLWYTHKYSTAVTDCTRLMCYFRQGAAAFIAAEESTQRKHRAKAAGLHTGDGSELTSI